MRHTRPMAILLALTWLAPAAVHAGPAQDEVIKHYAELAKTADPAFSGFAAADGEAFFLATHSGGGPETPSCTTCHTKDPTQVGMTRAGKAIDPMAVSAAPQRFTDLAKVEKWAGRNCNSVLGRDCSAKEIGDVITWLNSK
ncbi:MAG: DUF1924 domain-containing protein [Rhizobiaceae bacterium]